MIEKQSQPVRRDAAVMVLGGLLFLLVGVVFWKTGEFKFLNFDDNAYVYNNPVIKRGLTMDGLAWSFSHTHSNNWHPLTTLSHMLDCSLFGVKPGGHHLVNVALHAINAVLLLTVLFRMTGELTLSLLAAALFAIHPLRVESVAWISERKDVLSGLFFLVTLWAYIEYTRRKPWSLPRYLLVLLSFALGLLCKPMLVTTPFVLLLLDYWPLQRFVLTEDHQTRWATIRLRLLEKLPLLTLSLASCCVTVFAQHSARDHVDGLSPRLQIENAISSYATYVAQTIWPVDLVPLYTYPTAGIAWWHTGLAAILILAISAIVVVGRRSYPWLLVGWLWYLGTLVPVIGFIQVGIQAHADRYTYIPQIGLWIMIIWSTADMSRRLQLPFLAAAAVAGAVIVWFSIQTYLQETYWRDSETLWKHTLAITPGNVRAYNFLGLALGAEGRKEEEIATYRAALSIETNGADAADALNNMGNCQVKLGRLEDAMQSYRLAVEAKPTLAIAHDNLAELLSWSGKYKEALEHYSRASKLDPQMQVVYIHWGVSLVRQGKPDDAVEQFRRAICIDPASATAYYYSATTLASEGKFDEAITNYLQALHYYPGLTKARLELGAALVAARRSAEAIEELEEANRLLGQTNLPALSGLVNAYASAGKFEQAIATLQKALELANSLGQMQDASIISGRIEDYRLRLQNELPVKASQN